MEAADRLREAAECRDLVGPRWAYLVGTLQLLFHPRLLAEQPATTARYVHQDDDPRRAAAARISSEIAAALNGQAAGELLPFKRP